MIASLEPPCTCRYAAALGRDCPDPNCPRHGTAVRECIVYVDTSNQRDCAECAKLRVQLEQEKSQRAAIERRVLRMERYLRGRK